MKHDFFSENMILLLLYLYNFFTDIFRVFNHLFAYLGLSVQHFTNITVDKDKNNDTIVTEEIDVF